MEQKNIQMIPHFDEDDSHELHDYKTRSIEFIGDKHRLMLWFDEDRKEPHGWCFAAVCQNREDTGSYGAIPEEFINSLYEWIKWYKNEYNVDK